MPQSPERIAERVAHLVVETLRGKLQWQKDRLPSTPHIQVESQLPKLLFCQSTLYNGRKILLVAEEQAGILGVVLHQPWPSVFGSRRRAPYYQHRYSHADLHLYLLDKASSAIVDEMDLNAGSTRDRAYELFDAIEGKPEPQAGFDELFGNADQNNG